METDTEELQTQQTWEHGPESPSSSTGTSTVVLSSSNESVTSSIETMSASSVETSSWREDVLSDPGTSQVDVGETPPPLLPLPSPSLAENTMTSLAQMTSVALASTSATAQQQPKKPLNFKLQISQGGGVRLAPDSAAPATMIKSGKAVPGAPVFFVDRSGKGQPRLLMSFVNQPSKLFLLQASAGQKLNLKVDSPQKEQAGKKASSTSGVNVFPSLQRLAGWSGALQTARAFPSGQKPQALLMPHKTSTFLKPECLKSQSSREAAAAASSRLQSDVKRLGSLLLNQQLEPGKCRSRTSPTILNYKKRKSTARKSCPPAKRPKASSLLGTALAKCRPHQASDSGPSTSFQDTGFEDGHNFPFKIDSVFSLASSDQPSDITWEEAESEMKEEKSTGTEELCQTLDLKEISPEDLLIMYGSSFVVLERLDTASLDRRGSADQIMSKCSDHCRNRTLNYLCMLGLIRCHDKRKRKLEVEEVAEMDREAKVQRAESVPCSVVEETAEDSVLKAQAGDRESHSSVCEDSGGAAVYVEASPQKGPPAGMTDLEVENLTRVPPAADSTSTSKPVVEDRTDRPDALGRMPIVSSSKEMSPVPRQESSCQDSPWKELASSSTPLSAVSTTTASDSMSLLSAISGQRSVAPLRSLLSLGADFKETFRGSELQHERLALTAGAPCTEETAASSESRRSSGKEGAGEEETCKNIAGTQARPTVKSLAEDMAAVVPVSFQSCVSRLASSEVSVVDTVAFAPLVVNSTLPSHTSVAQTQILQELKLCQAPTPAPSVIPVVLTASHVPVTKSVTNASSVAGRQAKPPQLQFVLKLASSTNSTSSAPLLSFSTKNATDAVPSMSNGQVSCLPPATSVTSIAPRVVKILPAPGRSASSEVSAAAARALPGGEGVSKAADSTFPPLSFVNIPNPVARVLSAPAMPSGISLLTGLPGSQNLQLKGTGQFPLLESVLSKAAERSTAVPVVASASPALSSAQAAAVYGSSDAGKQAIAQTTAPLPTPGLLSPIRVLPAPSGNPVLSVGAHSLQQASVTASEPLKKTGQTLVLSAGERGAKKPNAAPSLLKKVILQTSGAAPVPGTKQVSSAPECQSLGSQQSDAAIKVIQLSSSPHVPPVHIVPAVNRTLNSSVLSQKTAGLTSSLAVPTGTEMTTALQQASSTTPKFIKVLPALTQQQSTTVSFSDCFKVISNPSKNPANQRAVATSCVTRPSPSSGSFIRIPVIPPNPSDLQKSRSPTPVVISVSKALQDQRGISLLGSSQSLVGSAVAAVEPVAAGTRTSPTAASAELPVVTVVKPPQGSGLASGQVTTSSGRKQPRFKIILPGTSASALANQSVNVVYNSSSSGDKESPKGNAERQTLTMPLMYSLLGSFPMLSPGVVVTSSESSGVTSSVVCGSESALASKTKGPKSKLTRLQEKYPLPPGVVIKTESLAFGYPTDPEPPDPPPLPEFETWSEHGLLSQGLPFSDTLAAPDGDNTSALDVSPSRESRAESAIDSEERTQLPLDYESADPPVSFQLTNPDFDSDSGDPPTDLECPDLEPTEGEAGSPMYDEPPVLTPVLPLPSLPEPVHNPVLSEKRKSSSSKPKKTHVRKKRPKAGSKKSKSHTSSSRVKNDPSLLEETRSDDSPSFCEDGELMPDLKDSQDDAGTPSLRSPLTSLYSSSRPQSVSTSSDSSSTTSKDRIRQLKEMLKKQNEELEQVRLRRQRQGPVVIPDN